MEISFHSKKNPQYSHDNTMTEYEAKCYELIALCDNLFCVCVLWTLLISHSNICVFTMGWEVW